MANTIDVDITLDGERNVIAVINITGEAAGSDESGTTVIDMSTLSGSPDNLRIDRVEANLSGFDAVLLFDATTDDQAVAIPDGDSVMDFKRMGGRINPKGTGYNGDILLTTNGLTVAADRGTIKLEMTKRYS